MYSQLCWAKKDWACAITKAESVKTAMGAKVKPKVYKQLAYSYSGKNDFASARTNIDEFFKRSKPEDRVPPDFELKANIYQGGGASCEEVYALYMEGAAADTVLSSKVDFMTKAADYFKTKGCKLQEADMRLALYNTRKSPNPGGLANLGISYFQAGNLVKADSLFAAYNAALPDSIYGYYWRGRANYQLDTTMLVEPYATNMVQNYQKTLDVAFTDRARYRTHGTQAALLLAGYYNNIKSSRDSALMYVLKGLEIDSTNAPLRNIKDIFDKQPVKGTKPPAKTTGNKPTSSIRKPDSKS